MVKNRKTKEPFARPADKYAETVIRKISRFLLDEKNLYIPADKFGIWIVPPLIVNEDELDFIVKAIDEALKIADAEITQ